MSEFWCPWDGQIVDRSQEHECPAPSEHALDKKCPHGDSTCPCQDGDLCHYEGEDPMTPALDKGETE